MLRWRLGSLHTPQLLSLCSAVVLMSVSRGPVLLARVPHGGAVWTRQELAAGIAAVDRQFSAEYAKDHAAGLTVGIVSGPELIWSKSYGEADVAAKRAASADTVYRIGSITKEFTALMLLQLVDQGKVHFSDPVVKYVPEITRIPSTYSSATAITLIQLATHHSGLSKEPEDVEEFTTGPVNQWEQVLVAALPRLKYEAEPGTRFIYSNIGYAILGLALSRATGEAFTEYVEQHIFQPLAMAHTRFQPDAPMLPAMATGYVLHDGLVDPTQPARELLNGRGYKVPNGAVFTTVRDLAHFMSFQMGYGPDRVLKRSALLETQSEVFWAKADLDSGYGIGTMLVRQGKTIALGHGGSVSGFLAGEYFDPTTHLGIIFLRNAEGHGFEREFVVRLLDKLRASAHSIESGTTHVSAGSGTRVAWPRFPQVGGMHPGLTLPMLATNALAVRGSMPEMAVSL